MGNPHRGSHILAIEASEDYENARDRVVEFINAREREEVYLHVIVQNL